MPCESISTICPKCAAVVKGNAEWGRRPTKKQRDEAIELIIKMHKCETEEKKNG